MALFDIPGSQAVVSFTTSLVTYQEEFKAGHVVLPSATRRSVHVTLAQCTDNLCVSDGLMVHEIVDAPKVLLWRVWLPDPRITFNYTEAERSISVAYPDAWRFTLKFNAEREFWKVACIVADVKGNDARRRYTADDLLRKAAVAAFGSVAQLPEGEQGLATAPAGDDVA
ncbi:hypothetical protein OH76DRAFT_1421470 [Lentinus brumalis]|uniref:Uncharacterized protein n=1 Tax=Lentinus brumalis TaxID=2498619 RepID=A0A371CVF9_9APHY|nr:hypothetical protein OH76DRAFT_1421470 [Polyporus brumalis]